MRAILRICLCALLLALPVQAQDSLPLYLFNTAIGSQPDFFGGEMRVARGELFNHGAEAYTNITLSLSAYDAAGQLIGEGFGYLVDACGTALLDYSLPAGAYQGFSAPFERLADGDIARLELEVAADAAASPPASPSMPMIRQISDKEVVALEWLDDSALIFGAGCDGALFTELDWQRYSLADNALSDIEHPNARKVTPELIANSGAATITQSGEPNPALFASSQMTFPPQARRVVYQNDLHTLFSAEPDGSFPRLIHDGLHQYSLRDFQWARQPGVFLAVYFGGYAEPVRYFAATTTGRLLSQRLEDMPASLTVPAPTADGTAALVGRVRAGISGYYLQNVYGGSELLFQSDLPGNNYPAPVLDGERVYVFVEGGSAPQLRCYQRDSGDLQTLTALPLRLTRSTRAWAWLSPGGGQLALAANGADGGLWLVDVADSCG
ncbi:MAG: hypothetical protein OXE95_05640 [Chloroflexi bacterium]|nr:hypothetical protein [Chloroflexota bacterium]MCY4247044.1 hypothetical protein [Chloroflexota bacterium]